MFICSKNSVDLTVIPPFRFKIKKTTSLKLTRKVVTIKFNTIESQNGDDTTEQFKIIGYYICEVIDTPEWLRDVGKQVLSVSSCIGEQHPKQECFMGGWCKGERQEYQKLLKMNDGQYKNFLDAATQLFDLKRLDIDCRFLQLSDAQGFYKKIRSEINCRIVSISTIPKYYEVLEKELKGTNSHGLMSGSADNSLWVGNDILGWDLPGFHSFLCNSLQVGLPGVKFNNMGLLANDFQDVINYAGQTKGLGEPVEWLPYRLGIYE